MGAQKVRAEDGWGLHRNKERKSSVEARGGWREECQRNGTCDIWEGDRKMVVTAHPTCPTSEVHLRAGQMPLQEPSLPYHQGFHNSPASRNQHGSGEQLKPHSGTRAGYRFLCSDRTLHTKFHTWCYELLIWITPSLPVSTDKDPWLSVGTSVNSVLLGFLWFSGYAVPGSSVPRATLPGAESDKC